MLMHRARGQGASARLSTAEARILWAPLYEAIFQLLGASAVILPLGDTRDENAGRTTCTTRRNSATGVNAVFTYSEAVTGFDTPPGFEGDSQIPIVTFNGTDERLTSPDADYWTAASGALSLRVWVRVDAVGGNNRVLFAKGGASQTSGEWSLFVGGDNNLYGEIEDSTVPAYMRRIDTAGVTLGTWFHFAMTYDGSADVTGILLYVNGVQVDDTSGTSGVLVDMRNTSEIVSIGDGNAAAQEFDGSFAGGPLGPVFVQAALTADQILRDYALGRAALGI